MDREDHGTHRLGQATQDRLDPRAVLRQERVGLRVVGLGQANGQVEGGERLVGVLPRERRRQPERWVVRERQVHPADDGAEVGREVLGRAGLDAEGAAGLDDGPGPAVLGVGEVGLRDGDRDPVPGVGLAPLDQPPQPGRLGEPGGGEPSQARGGGVRPDQRLGHPLHHDLPADDPRLVGLVDPHRPLVADSWGPGALGRSADPEPVRDRGAVGQPLQEGHARAVPGLGTAPRPGVVHERRGAWAVVGLDHTDRVGRSESQQVSLRHGAPGRPAR